MQLPRDIVIGHGVLSSIPAVSADLRLGRSALVITGTHTRDLAGEQVMGFLSEQYDVRSFVTGTISMQVIRDAEQVAQGADFIVGVGGGRVIDTAKIVSYNLDRQFISVPTAASHDGIASARASVPMEEGSASLEAHPPIAIIADTEVIARAPHRLLAAGCADIMSNYTACLDWELAHRMKGEPVSEYAIALSRMTAELLMKNAKTIKPCQEESAWFVIKALVSSGVAMSIAGSSRPGLRWRTQVWSCPGAPGARKSASRGGMRDRDDHLHVPARRELEGDPGCPPPDRCPDNTGRNWDSGRHCS